MVYTSANSYRTMVVVARAKGPGGRSIRKQTQSEPAHRCLDFTMLGRGDASYLYLGAGLCCGYSPRRSARDRSDLRCVNAATVCCSVTSVE
jgi:hypothetical protein